MVARYMLYVYAAALAQFLYLALTRTLLGDAAHPRALLVLEERARALPPVLLSLYVTALWYAALVLHADALAHAPDSHDHAVRSLLGLAALVGALVDAFNVAEYVRYATLGTAVIAALACDYEVSPLTAPLGATLVRTTAAIALSTWLLSRHTGQHDQLYWHAHFERNALEHMVRHYVRVAEHVVARTAWTLLVPPAFLLCAPLVAAIAERAGGTSAADIYSPPMPPPPDDSSHHHQQQQSTPSGASARAKRALAVALDGAPALLAADERA